MTALSRISSDRLIGDLDLLVRQPSSAGEPDSLAAMAGQVAVLMRQRGLETTLLETPGAPLVIGRRAGRNPATLLLYHHYDTAPAGAWQAWHHEPFQLSEREGMLFGRGVASGKGALAAHLGAIEALLAEQGELECGVVVLAEGEGLTGSAGLVAVAGEHTNALRADACLASGGERDAEGHPLCYAGAKGMLQVRLRVEGGHQALQPGMAVSVANPLWRLLWALGQLKSDQEEVLIDGFYDDVDSLSRAEGQAFRDVALDGAGRLEAWGLAHFLFDISGAALARVESTLPTCNVARVVVEPSIELPLIPRAAAALVDFQLVPRQQPQRIVDLLRDYLREKGLDDVTVERVAGGYAAVHTPLDHPFVQQVVEAGGARYGAPLKRLPHGPFALPLSVLAGANAPAATIGYARPDSATFGPNERVPLADLLEHGQILLGLLRAFGASE